MAFLLRLLSCESSLDVQIVLLAFQTVFWCLCRRFLVRTVIRPFIKRHPMSQQYGELCQRTLGSFDVHMSFEQAYDTGLLIVAASFQNVVGGALTLPAFLGFRGGLVATLARHGALCELGEEMQDGLRHIWEVTFGGKEGRARNPPVLLVLALLHHMAGMCFVIPMNLYYPENYSYFKMVFMLQGAAGSALLAQQMGFLLDVRTISGMRYMRWMTAGIAVISLYTRGFGYLFASVELFNDLRPTSSTWFLTVGVFAATCMATFNLLIVKDAVLRARKFCFMPIRKEHPELEIVRPEVVQAEGSGTLLTQRRQQSSPEAMGVKESESMPSGLEQ